MIVFTARGLVYMSIGEWIIAEHETPLFVELCRDINRERAKIR